MKRVVLMTVTKVHDTCVPKGLWKVRKTPVPKCLRKPALLYDFRNPGEWPNETPVFISYVYE